MIDKFSTENLQVGDKVIVVRTGLGSRSRYVGEIIKKTPTGLVDVKYANVEKHRFRADGNDYSASDGWTMSFIRLEEATEEKVAEINRVNRRIAICRTLREIEWENYTDEELENIYSCVLKPKTK